MSSEFWKMIGEKMLEESNTRVHKAEKGSFFGNRKCDLDEEEVCTSQESVNFLQELDLEEVEGSLSRIGSR